MSKFIFCDLEATGNRKQDRIIQLGLIIFEKGTKSCPEYVFNELNSVNANMMSEAMELHNITPEMLVGKKDLHSTEGYKMLCKFNLSENFFIVHDAQSDLKMLEKEDFVSKLTIIDTLKCAKHIYSTLNIHRLQFLRYELELYKKETAEAEKMNIILKAHDALSDAIVTKLLFEQLILETANKFSITSEFEAIQKLIELSSVPVLLQRFSFGKYKGEDIKDILRSDYKYVRWMRNTLELDEDMRYTLDYYL